MGFLVSISLVFYSICSLSVQLTDGTCQCNQMLHPGVFSGERMTFVAEGNHDRETRSDDGGKQSFNMGAISFEPPYLDFGEQPIGMPYVHDVMVVNPSSEKNLQLQAFSGDNTHFHISFLKSKALSPLTNTTFEVIFLARRFGNVANTLFIHTSSGAYPYQVRGYGVANPYRLRPFLGARVALDHVFSSVIYMHNPHESTLQVTEIYSSGGDLHLELPSSEEEAPPEHWQIAPYETKAIIRMNFLGRVASNHTAFIRIRTNQFMTPNQFLILPVEVEVSAAPGLFSAVDQLDFGTLRKMDEPKTIVVCLMNTHNKPISLTEVIVEPPNRAIKIHVKNSVIKPAQKYVKSFSVTFTAGHLKNLKQNYGKIVVLSTSKSNPKLEINFQVNVLQGTLAYSVSRTRFFIGSAPYKPVLRDIIITNTFTFPLVIHRVVPATDVHHSLSIVNFSSPTLVEKQKTIAPFSIRFSANKAMSTFVSSIRVHTNASIFTIPVHCFDGKLQFRFGEGNLDFGTLAVDQRSEKVYQIYNPNPVEVTVKPSSSNNSLAKLDYLELAADKHDRFLDIPADGLTIKPGRVINLRVEMIAPSVDGDFSGKLSFRTTYENKVMFFAFKAASGHIKVDPVNIVFGNSFPGHTEKASVFLTSTFLNPVNVLSTSVNPDGLFTFVPIQKSHAQLAPNNRQKIGDVVFNPQLACSSDCYLGIGNTKSKDKAWFSSLSLPADTARIDTLILESFQAKWNSLLETRENSFNRNILIHTETVKGIEVKIQGGLTWPSLTPDRPIRFPLTHVGNISHKTLMLENPADVPVVVQVVPLSLYPDAQSAIDVLSDRFDVDLLTSKPSYHSCFSLPTAKINRYLLDKPDSDVTLSFEATLGVPTSPDVISMVIPPRSKANVSLQFKPENEDQRTSVILIRNNLTVLDVVTVQGQGARGEFMINGKRPSVESVVLFELKQRHLEDCTKLNPNTGGKPYRSLTVKKTVLATNPGQLVTQVTSFSIDGYECEGYGFKVLNCKALSLKPSASVKIDIAFTPDFSVSRVSRRLQIKTSLGNVFEFSLIATIPSELIPLCAAAAGRPGWEFHAYLSSIVIMICLLVVVMVLAHFEASKLINANLTSLPPNQIYLNGTHMNGELFDLRKISASTRTSLRGENLYHMPREDNNESVRAARKEVITAEKTKITTYSQPFRRSSSNSCERLASNNNSITTETSEYERHKVRVNDKDPQKKQKKTTSSNQQTKRKDSDIENPKPFVFHLPAESAMDTSTVELVNPECYVNELVKAQRDSSLSVSNSVCSDVTVAMLSGKKDKMKMRKKTAKVAPACLVEEKKTKVVDKVRAIDSETSKEKEETEGLERGKEKKVKQTSDVKDDCKETKKRDVKSKPIQNNKASSKTSRSTSLPSEFEQAHVKTKLDKSKSLPTGSTNKQQSSKSSAVNKKSFSSPDKKQHENGTPHTITEAINSALEITLKHSPTADGGFSRSHSRCSSQCPSPSLSDSSHNLSQSSRSSSYSSVVGSEESANSEPRKKKQSKNQKPSPLVIQKPAEQTNPFSVKRLGNNNICNSLSGPAWREPWGCTTRDPRSSSALKSFPSSSTSSSLFTSTPFDKDGKLERYKSTKDASADDDQNPDGDKFPLYTFHDVKVPGLSTPFVDADTSVPKFWPDEPIPSLEDLIPIKQTRNTNWVNFLDESSANTTSNLPSPGMPQSTKTVAEIWDAGHLADENDGWSTAFSPTMESDQVFPPFPGAYDSAWSTGTYQHDYYGMPSGETWFEDEPSTTTNEMPYPGSDKPVYSSGTKLNPYSEPWDGSAKQNAWASSSPY